MLIPFQLLADALVLWFHFISIQFLFFFNGKKHEQYRNSIVIQTTIDIIILGYDFQKIPFSQILALHN